MCQAMLKGVGFELTAEKGIHNLPSSIDRELGLNDQESQKK